MKNTDLPEIAKEYKVIITKGEVESEYPLAFALSRYGNEEMVTDFAKCGNEVLKNMAFWMKSARGYRINYESKNGPLWGEKGDQVRKTGNRGKGQTSLRVPSVTNINFTLC